MRSSRSEPLYQVVSKSDWLLETYADAYKQIAGPIAMFDPGNDAHLQIVIQQALQRLVTGSFSVPDDGTPRLSASPGCTQGNLIIVDVLLLF